MRIELKSLPHLQLIITLADMSDGVTSKANLQVFGREVRTVGIVPGPILEQFLCDCLGIYNDDVPSQESYIDKVSWVHNLSR